ncbi:uncharacterized membrane protein YhaH (DUF805 family) [Rhodovulum bhavnagarense]|uniref:Uncharacterized membrane protein YhaH (DUF805 family) n=1 Tax=Rhodovulum bhavnagarense TaxID=992286 RepID=A0A4R2RSW2_9RHOB|nr:DUF805 domain-containing protein [Rhodovulum bhavnagarense]TCP62225.1 uncharacterized membrane protein YhaH (DUF805 family) [Rhodovulum bhavnagarense]
MGFAEATRTCFRKYVTFSGRAARPEFWWFVLFLSFGSLVAGALDGLFLGRDVRGTGTGPLGAVFGLGTLAPGLAAGWRRMHDTGRSGLFLFYPLIVMIGIGSFTGIAAGFAGTGPEPMVSTLTGLAGLALLFAMLILMISPLLVLWWLTRPSEPGPNQYGPNPHEVVQ